MSKTASQKLLRDLNQRIGQLEHEKSLMAEYNGRLEQQLAALREELDSHDEYTLCDCCQSLTLEPVDAGDHMQCGSCTELANAQAQLAALLKQEVK